ncbi:MAG: hypothetical protein ACR2H0_03900 [Candidatus Limnocylindrales bacterium]
MSKRIWLSNRRPEFPGADIVSRDAHPGALQGGEIDLEAGSILNLLTLGQLDDHPARIDARHPA